MTKSPKKILIVEDEISIAKALKMKLEREGFRAFLADNGKKGLTLALKEIPDLILLDIVMPVMDGMTMMEKLRAEPAGKKIKVLILTNLSYLTGDVSDKYKVTDYLVKSDWKISDLIAKIKTIIKA
ncbi:response regulator [Candidatus Falkowbacteria bacterium CG10_big_fil_rev_8_21_14_0_10_39_9]|uniref:Response regulator n=1 Tax=Candidatus Falkowbacteria bacterium CG10_big_fil_rev_8_21_14_0_10_39_9 TaxID=1974566 RepID=A0A2M6WQU4_9BACT|nr:MAG: response regulator [Candidatus Falkowbacteria bacterium CG10_big_fil_rev_8_21_14_0_10_39_9]